jgi:hypothetical protein
MCATEESNPDLISQEKYNLSKYVTITPMTRGLSKNRTLTSCIRNMDATITPIVQMMIINRSFGINLSVYQFIVEYR